MSLQLIQKRYQKIKLWKIDTFKGYFLIYKLNIDLILLNGVQSSICKQIDEKKIVRQKNNIKYIL